MAKTALLIVLSLVYLSNTPCAFACNSDGPENCTFYRYGHYTPCSWSSGGTFVHYNSGHGHHYCAGLSPDQEEGKLTSRTACSTQGVTHCLQFSYGFSRLRVIDLSVMVTYEGSNQAQSPMWTVSSSNGWARAAVPINTTRDFSIIFRAKRRPEHVSSSHTAFVDDIVYSKSPCRSGLIPPKAQPTTPTTKTKPSESADTTPEGLTTSENSDITAEKTESDEVGIIVGVIVAVLVVIIAVIVVLLVVFRRKHLHILKTCWGKKQPKEQFHMNASDNAAYSLDADGSAVNNTQQNSDNDRREAGAPSRSPANHVYANSPSETPSQPVYAMVNKPRKANQESTPPSRGKPNTTIYELCNEGATNDPKPAGVEYQNVPSTTPKQEQNGKNISSTPVPSVCGVYSLAKPQNETPVYLILEKDPETESRSVYHVPNTVSTVSSQGPDTEYNRLNFSQKSGAENCDGQKSEKAAGGVYNHLNEGRGDAYTEVQREKKAEVIDGVYSHIK